MSQQHSFETAAMGFDDKGAARDRSSLFAAAGLEWPVDAKMESEFGRDTDYPFSVDVSNNRVLTSLDRNGNLRRVVTAVGVDDVRGEGIPGVYINKQLAFCEGTIGARIAVDGSPQLAPSLSFLDGVFPTFTNHDAGVTITRTVFAPDDGTHRRARIVVLIAFNNQSEDERTVEVAVHSATRSVGNWPLLNYSVSLITDTTSRASLCSSYVLPPGGSQEIALVIDFDALCEPAKSEDSLDQIRASLVGTGDQRTGNLGRLTVPEDPWFGELATRASELARQSVLVLEDGSTVGSFWGSNANPIPDVWHRDLGYATLGLIESDPDLAATTIAFLADFGLPEQAWGFALSVSPDAKGIEHSLGNACVAAVLASLLISRHGSSALDAHKDSLHSYLRRLAQQLLDLRPAPGELYRTLYISDGPSRGDYHTGSNILAWRAATALSTDFAAVIGEEQATALAQTAHSLRDAIEGTCIRRVDGVEMYVEGVYGDGNIVAVHDGEESDLTLAPVYGFAPRDDYAIREHARWAHSPGNPYFAKTTGGVDFWDWDDSNGITYPGHIHALSAAGTRDELAEALHAIRRTTDLDGSFWWWPFPHAEKDEARATRSLGKCGWCAGEFLSVLLHDIVGVERNHAEATLTFAPYAPWREFSWQGLAFLDGEVDVHAEENIVRASNRTGQTIHVMLQVPLQPGVMLENVLLNGEDYRVDSEVVQLFDSVAVRVRAELAPGKTATLEAVVLQK